MKKKSGIFRQRHIGKQWGILAQITSQMSILMTMLILIFSAVSAYNNTEVVNWLWEHGIHLTFWMLAGIVAVLLVAGGFLAYIFGMPSFFTVFSDQFYRHNNPFVRDIKEVKRGEAEIKGDVENIKRMLTDDLHNLKKRVEKLEEERK